MKNENLGSHEIRKNIDKFISTAALMMMIHENGAYVLASMSEIRKCF